MFKKRSKKEDKVVKKPKVVDSYKDGKDTFEGMDVYKEEKIGVDKFKDTTKEIRGNFKNDLKYFVEMIKNPTDNGLTGDQVEQAKKIITFIVSSLAMIILAVILSALILGR